MVGLQQHLNKIAEVFYRMGGATAIICPGSRNAPIIVAFARHPKLKCIPITDERSAAFIGLGIAQQTRKPVAIICTSGTATANFYPAIIEAFYQNIPLIVITADRPPEYIDQWDGQAIRQHEIYKNHILQELNTPYPLFDCTTKEIEDRLVPIIGSAILQRLPIHINVALQEPFYPSENETYIYDEEPIQAPESSLLGIHKSTKDIFEIAIVLKQIKKQAENKNLIKILILIGFNDLGNNVMHAIRDAQKKLHFPIIADVIAHYPFEDTIQSYDFLLNGKEGNPLQPDILITVGNAILSKNVRKHFRSQPPQYHVHIQEIGYVGDPFQSLTHVLRSSPLDFFNQLHDVDINIATYFEKWKRIDAKITAAICKIRPNFSELKAASLLLNCLPENSHLQLSNSMPIRYAMIFGINKTITVYSNRGTSGIEGCSSTAVGAAWSNNSITTLITGDIAFFYDINAFWNKLQLSLLRIVLLNNGGGGIFRLIEGPSKLKELEEFIENAHHRTAAHVAADFNFEYHAVHSETQLKEALIDFYSPSNRPKILEVFTDKTENQQAYALMKQQAMLALNENVI